MKPDLVVIRAGTRWDGSMMTDQHLARELSRHVRVLYVDPVASPLRRDRTVAAVPPLTRVADNILRVRPPSVARPNRRITREISDALLQRAVKRQVAAAKSLRPALIAVEASPLFDDLTFPLRVYWSTDDLVAGASLIGQDPISRRRRDERMAREADLVVACSEILQRRWAPLRSDVVMIPNGVDATAFKSVCRAARDRHIAPRAGFVGTIGKRIDFDVLDAVASTGIEVTLIGPLQRTADRRPFDRLLERHNVEWLGFQPFENLPSLVSKLTVGMTPYGDDDFNRASFPLKTLEYLAAGLPVVSTNLPATRWLDTNLVRIADSPADFAEQVLNEARRSISRDEQTEREEFAGKHSWESRAERWWSLLEVA